MSSTRPDLKFLDNGDERSYYRKYQNLPAKDKKTIRFIDHNKDYFTSIDDDAELVADNIYKTQSVIKYNKGSNHKYVTISPQVFTNNVLKFCLIEGQYKVEIYNSKTFELVSVATSGNLESISNEYNVDLEGMFKDYSTPKIAGVKYLQSAAQKKVGVCIIDLSTRSILVSEFEDNDFFSNLESLIIQLGVKEILIPSNYQPEADNKDDAKLLQVLDRIDHLIVSSTDVSTFSNKDIEKDLSRYLATSTEHQTTDLVLASKGIDSIKNALSLSCCNALFHYLDIFTQDSVTFTIEKYSLSRYMKLDSSAMSALNIFPAQASTLYDGRSSNISSIFELLNKCKSSAGSKLLSQWLKQPLTDLEEIGNRQDLVEFLIDNTTLRTYLTQDWLTQIPDIKRILKKLANGRNKSSSNENKKLDDVVHLYQLVIILPELLRTLSDAADTDASQHVGELIRKCWLDPICTYYESLLKFQQLVETTIDLSPLESSSAHDLLNAEFNIKPEFDESLIEINDALQSTLSKMKEIHMDTAEDLNIDIEKKLKLEKHQIHGWCFRVTRNDSFVLRNAADKCIELQTVKAGVYFTTRELRNLSRAFQESSDQYNSKQRDLIKEILSISLTYQSVFQSLASVLAHLDILNSFANVAISVPITYVKPKLHPLSPEPEGSGFESRKINLEEARHPLIEIQDDVNFIANDVKMSNSKKDNGKSFGIITGPNMGGKSTYIRSVGVISLLAQVGSFIPASETNGPPEIPIFDAILSRVGAGDSQVKGLSTFMLEMIETSSILATASHNSLIIIDELGRGTSTYDGFGLAWAISENLITEKKSFAIFATHFHELTKLADKYDDKVVNLHVTAYVENEQESKDDITLMYKVEEGTSDTSFGIHVAELVRFPEKIIKMAKRKASELQQSTDSTIDAKNKKTRCSTDEINAGTEILKDLLKAWKARCCGEESENSKLDSQGSIEALKDLAVHEFKDKIANDKYINEILDVL